MSEMAEIFNAMREVKAQKRKANTISSTEWLQREGISFVSNNGGVHLIVGNEIDFWPSTGLWMVRHTRIKRRGVRSLINFLKARTA